MGRHALAYPSRKRPLVALRPDARTGCAGETLVLGATVAVFELRADPSAQIVADPIPSAVAPLRAIIPYLCAGLGRAQTLRARVGRVQGQSRRLPRSSRLRPLGSVTADPGSGWRASG